jgi:hypothetical protein
MIAFALSETIGLAAAIWPRVWLGLFGDDPLMLAAGASYLHQVGPAYGFFGLGLALYFASQGAGRLGWPLIRRVSNSMTVGAIAIVVGVFVAAMAIVGGLDSAIKDSSSPDNMILIGRAADSEANSFITLDQLDALKFLPAIKRDDAGNRSSRPNSPKWYLCPPATPWTTFPFAACCP